MPFASTRSGTAVELARNRGREVSGWRSRSCALRECPETPAISEPPRARDAGDVSDGGKDGGSGGRVGGRAEGCSCFCRRPQLVATAGDGQLLRTRATPSQQAAAADGTAGTPLARQPVQLPPRAVAAAPERAAEREAVGSCRTSAHVAGWRNGRLLLSKAPAGQGGRGAPTGAFRRRAGLTQEPVADPFEGSL